MHRGPRTSGADKKSLQAPNEARKAQSDLLAMQGKSLVSFRDETEESAKIREETLSLQKQATARIRQVGAFPFADKIVWVFLAVCLIVRYRILESVSAGSLAAA